MNNATKSRKLMKLTAKQLKRINRVAGKSGISADHWLKGVIDCALANDEAHFAEMADREKAEKEVDRLQFSRLSSELKGLRTGTVDLLVRTVADARMQGREEALKKA